MNKERMISNYKKILNFIGYDYRHWTRPVMYDACTKLLVEIGAESLDVLEISAGQYWKTLPFRSFSEMNYPEYDICRDTLKKNFDLIIADQVFEHLLRPYQAAQNVYSMLNPNGYFLISTPFLIKYHPIPNDCTRWTETGLRYFLAEAGFPIDEIVTGSWGNRSCVKANFNHWARRGWFGSLKNEQEFPVTVWALAKKYN
ncbi:class I SAM-dependent methyltransferase [Chromatium okenii]|jgi:SAM-dependent methyltransferase|uniref:Methyltransferase type 12 n=1 Tax=Chromatium okenii TaxID=61644 RepID=A0A2S7XPN0_9GAMM|nr:methyltransferase domain-containing protein [Chromatium okenii]MBV5311516.1 methyltransferase domain-containing protein [Chromatium okenii]PQJ95341.1 methyltransferase type 12 [Chromatium okenii]